MKNHDREVIRSFVAERKNVPNEFHLGLDAGWIDAETGHIIKGQVGAIDTFSIGMPVYSDDGEELGRLSIGLYESLNYSECAETKNGEIEIPVEVWEVKGYKGKSQHIKTFWQNETAREEQ